MWGLGRNVVRNEKCGEKRGRGKIGADRETRLTYHRY